MTDTERLDWVIECKATFSSTGIAAKPWSLKYYLRGKRGKVPNYGYKARTDNFPTPREAIDAAMNAPGKG